MDFNFIIYESGPTVGGVAAPGTLFANQLNKKQYKDFVGIKERTSKGTTRQGHRGGG